jgi:Flp pilus assembly protein TadD
MSARRTRCALARRLLKHGLERSLTMRNLKTILRAFAGAAALTTMVACEEAEPPKTTTQPVAVTPPQPQPKPEIKPEIKIEPKPEIAVTAKVEVPRAPKPPAVESDEKLTPSEAMAGARDAMSSGELDRALRLAKLAVAKMPKRSASWNTLGRVQLARGERKDARASFEKAVELNPSSSYAQNNLGLTLIYEGEYDEAVDALEEAVDLTPVEPYMWNNLGMAYEHLDRLEEARDAYRKAAALKSPRASENLARLEGVKSIRTARLDAPKMPVDDLPAIDGGNQ